MSFITDFADQAVLLPLMLAVGIGLAVGGWRRGALAWAGAVGVLLLVMLALKLGFHACGLVALRGAVLRDPSGHTAAGSFAYGGVTGLLRARAGRRMRAMLAWVALAALVIGASRVALGFHTVADVVAGAAVGLACAALLVRLAGPRPAGFSPRAALFGVVTAAIVLHGAHLPAEAAIGRVAALPMWPFSLCHGR